MDAKQNLLALGGYDEVIRLFDVAKKKDLGSLLGAHTGTITALQFYENRFLMSGAEDSDIIIWRCSDWTCLHKLSIMNKSKILDLSVHPSGKMLLSLYDNGVLRLWNLMTARCQYKKKMGCLPSEGGRGQDQDTDDDIIPVDGDAMADDSDEDSSKDQKSDGDNDEEDVKEIRMQDLSESERKPIQVKWFKGQGGNPRKDAKESGK